MSRDTDPGAPLERVGVARLGGEPTLVAQFGERAVRLADALDGVAPGSMIELIEAWDSLAPRLREPDTQASLDLGDMTWDPPVRPRKLLCAAANYTDQLEEIERSGGPVIAGAAHPFSFLKATTSLTGCGRPVAMPSYAEMLDWEAELAVVIGDPRIAADDPLGAVFGYTMLNELSLREFVVNPHPMGLDAVLSKSFDGAAPLGPWITLADQVGDPSDLPIALTVNSEVMQDGSTANMIFSVAELISFYASVLTLEAGDVIATGTPAGMGMGMSPPRYLRAGDVCEVRIGGLGAALVTPIIPRVNTV